MNKLSLKIVNPSRIMYDGEAEMVIMRTKVGDIGIMAGHQPLVTVLDYGVLKLKISENEEKRAAVLGGFVEVDGEGVNILTDIAEWSDEIDKVRAEKAKERAERRLSEKSDGLDIVRAENALKRAMVRLHVND